MLTITPVYHLQDRLFILSLDATSLKNAALNLVDAADRMHNEDEDLKAAGNPPNPKRLVSERTRCVVQSKRNICAADTSHRFMLKDQMGLITLLSQELPDISRRAEAIVDLAFNVRKSIRAMPLSIDTNTTDAGI
jgi:hypothetical protein